MPRPTYQTAQRSLADGLHDLNILAGNVVGPSDASWQDIAGTAAVNFSTVAMYLGALRRGALPATMLDVQAALPDNFAVRVSEVLEEVLASPQMKMQAADYEVFERVVVNSLLQLKDEADQHVRDRP